MSDWKMSISEISKIIYVSDTSNPPLPDRTTDAEIILKNSKNIRLTDWARTGHISQYTMKIVNPKELDLNDMEQSTIEGFFNDVILSCNLLMRYGAMRIHGTSMSRFQTKIVKEKPNSPTIEKNESISKISWNETSTHSTSYMLGVSFKEEIDELEIQKNLRAIQHIDSSKSELNLNDLKKSLGTYQIAISGLDRLAIFKNLFNALELACNCDGEDRNVDKLAKMISSIMHEKESNVEAWGKFNARTKHVDRNQKDEQTYKDGMDSLPSWITPLRFAVQKIIISRLDSSLNK